MNRGPVLIKVDGIWAGGSPALLEASWGEMTGTTGETHSSSLTDPGHEDHLPVLVGFGSGFRQIDGPLVEGFMLQWNGQMKNDFSDL